MNRAVHLHRPAPTVADLSETAEGMVQNAALKGYLHSIAQAYSTVYHAQTHQDFWGLREFYSTVKAINRSLSLPGAEMSSEILMRAVKRNFGGIPEQTPHVVREKFQIQISDQTYTENPDSPLIFKVSAFFSRIGLVPDLAPPLPVKELIETNLVEQEARHLMLLTHNNAALRLLFDQRILELSGNSTQTIRIKQTRSIMCSCVRFCSLTPVLTTVLDQVRK